MQVSAEPKQLGLAPDSIGDQLSDESTNSTSPSDGSAQTADPVVSAIEQVGISGALHAAGIIAALQNSGPAADNIERQGEALQKLFTQERIGGERWGCFRKGCYFLLAAVPERVEDIVDLRNQAAPNHMIAVTADAPPDKLVVLFAEEQTRK